LFNVNYANDYRNKYANPLVSAQLAVDWFGVERFGNSEPASWRSI
jgi:hypothetical protein